MSREFRRGSPRRGRVCLCVEADSLSRMWARPSKQRRPAFRAFRWTVRIVASVPGVASHAAAARKVTIRLMLKAALAKTKSASTVVSPRSFTLRSPAIVLSQGHRRDDLTSRPLRFWRVYDYLIAYAPEKPLLVLAVLHGRRNPRILAGILRGREQAHS